MRNEFDFLGWGLIEWIGRGVGGEFYRILKARYSLRSGFGHFSWIPSSGWGKQGLPTLLLPVPSSLTLSSLLSSSTSPQSLFALPHPAHPAPPHPLDKLDFLHVQSCAGKFHPLKTQKGGTRIHLWSEIRKANFLPISPLSLGVFTGQVEIEHTPGAGSGATSQSWLPSHPYGRYSLHSPWEGVLRSDWETPFLWNLASFPR